VAFLRAVFLKDLWRIRRDPAALLIAVTIPLLLAVLLRLISGGGGGRTPTAHLLVADHDGSFASSLLANALGQGPLKDLIETEAVSEENGRRLMDTGKASGLLIVPEGFGKKVLDREPVALTLITNPAQRILPGILEGVLGGMVDGLNGAQTVLGGEIDPLIDRLRGLDGPPPDNLVAEVSVAVNRLVQRADPYFFPPAIKVEIVKPEEKAEDERSFAEIFFPSMFFLSLVFAAQGLSDDLWKEKQRGTLRRALSGPGRLSLFFLGKLLAGGTVLVGIAAVALVLARIILRIPFANVPLAMIWGGASALFMLLLFTLLQLLAGTQRGGNLLTSGVTFPLVMVGGAFFPFEAMPDWMVRIGRLTPNGWALTQLVDILRDAIDPTALALSALGLLAVASLLFLAGLRRLAVFARS
jgi:ABC-type Na+ efflux pump permease subunit